MQDESRAYFQRIAELGGMLAAIEHGFFRREIAEAASDYQREVDAKRKLIVGVNSFCETDKSPIAVLAADEAVEPEQVESLRKTKVSRSNEDVGRVLDQIRRAAEGSGNLMPVLLDAARCRATVGEVMNAMADVYGRYEPGVS